MRAQRVCWHRLQRFAAAAWCTMTSPPVEAILRSSFGGRLQDWQEVGQKQVMGFSGAVVSRLVANCSDGKFHVVFKLNAKRLHSLPEDASEKDKFQASRVDESYDNEAAFLREHCEALIAAGVRIPLVYHLNTASDFVILMEGMVPESGWDQIVEIPAGPQHQAVLRWLARFHAAFLPSEMGGGGRQLRVLGMHELGTHLALAKRPPKEVDSIARLMDGFVETFRDADPWFASEDAKALGARLQAAAVEVSEALHPANAGRITMIHGDFKQANMFFRNSADIAEVAVVDWQWTGPGVGATDVIYLLAMASSDEIVDDLANQVLRPYHAELSAALGGTEAYPMDEFVLEFKRATVDFLRWLVAGRYPSFSPATVTKSIEKVDINHGVWRRSIARNVWLCKLASQYLSEFETQGMGM
mmetsp:Transcript_42732/g.96277  ORF Transcript_42732/g.96277 Transcript_42732/m.96277 type:complete len:415 (-) Transcript_42732:164-1408(-)